MISSLKNVLGLFPIVKIEIFNEERCLFVKTSLVLKFLILLKNHFKYQFKMLTCISGLDEPKLTYRFKIIYELLSIQYNNRIRVKCSAAELVPINSVESIYSSANW